MVQKFGPKNGSDLPSGQKWSEVGDSPEQLSQIDKGSSSLVPPKKVSQSLSRTKKIMNPNYGPAHKFGKVKLSSPAQFCTRLDSIFPTYKLSVAKIWKYILLTNGYKG